MVFESLVGKKFGKLTVIELAPKTKNRSTLWRCICECGNEKIARNKNLIEGITTDCGCVSGKGYKQGQKIARLTLLKEIPACRGRSWECLCDCGNKLTVKESLIRNGSVKSCGCLATEYKSIGNVLHNLCNTRINKIYQGMKNRCYLKKHRSYKNYGGRGITVCDEWLGKDGIVNFYKWAISSGYKEEKLPNGRNKWTLDRIDNNGNYEPNNCRWATALQQQNNTRHNRILEYKGEKLTLSEISRKYNIDVSTLHHRLKKYNLDVEKSIEEPIHTEMQRGNKKSGV